MLDRHFSNGIHWRRTTVNRSRGDVLYIHGLGESGLCFEKLMQRPELGRWRHFAPDLPGFGKSLWLGVPATLDDLAARVGRWIQEDFRNPVILVGHSMGGVVGQLVCEKRPEMTAGFVNVEANLSLDDCVFSGQAAQLTLPEFLEGGFERLVSGVYVNGIQDPAQRGYYASLRFCDPRAFHANSRELVEASRTGDLARRFSRLPGDKLYVAGTRDRDANAAPLELLASAGVLEAWADCGHWPFLDHPERFAGRLAQFLAGKWHGHPCP